MELSTLSDYADFYDLSAACEDCHRIVTLDYAALQNQLGKDFLVSHLAARLRCSSCGSANCKTLVQHRLNFVR